MPKINFPEVVTSRDIPACYPVLAIHKNSGEVVTVIRANNEMLYFHKDGSICHGTVTYFSEEYRVVREFIAGETLSITA